MRVTWAGTFEPSFSRNRKLQGFLDRSDARVDIVREDLWGMDRVSLASDGIRIRLLVKGLVAYAKLFVRLALLGRPDVYLVSYPGWFDMPIVAFVAFFKRRPVVFDPFISLSDTTISDRGLFEADSAIGRLSRWIDGLSVRLADVVIADTPAHLDLFRELSGGNLRGTAVVPLGADDDVFRPQADTQIDNSLVAFHGTFVPLQGLVTIVEAAALLEPHGVRVLIVGDGQDRPVLEAAIERTGAAVETPGLVPLEELPGLISSAAVCLGVFGDSAKAGRVVPHKVYECLALGKAVVTREGPAIQGLLMDGELVLVPPGDADALATAVLGLINNPKMRDEIAAAGRKAYVERFHEKTLAIAFYQSLELATSA